MSSPLFNLAGRAAIVTGSSEGIGKSVALHLALASVPSRRAPSPPARRGSPTVA
jgi:hypothetical protein